MGKKSKQVFHKADGNLQRFSFKSMGGPCELLMSGAPDELAEAFNRVVVEVNRLEQKYSRYRDDSLTSKINRSAGSGEAVAVDEETRHLLEYADTAFVQSDGLFDITAGVFRQVWDFKSGQLPEQKALEVVLQCVGWDKVVKRENTITLPVSGMELDFGGYVKEYAADAAASVCREFGIRHGLVDLAGDLAVIGSPVQGGAWPVGIRDPRNPSCAIATVNIHQGGLASSGDYERYMLVNGRRYCHLLNPKTGWPVETMASVSVIADQCLVAGTATTIAMLKGCDEGLAWLNELGLPYLAIDQDLCLHRNS